MSFLCVIRYRSKLRKHSILGLPPRSSHNLGKAVKTGTAPTVGEQLLSDIRQVFMNLNVSKLRTVRLISILCFDSSKLWETYCSGRGIEARTLNSMLQNEFSLHSKDIRFSRRVYKGFTREAIESAWKDLNREFDDG